MQDHHHGQHLDQIDYNQHHLHHHIDDRHEPNLINSHDQFIQFLGSDVIQLISTFEIGTNKILPTFIVETIDNSSKLYKSMNDKFIDKS